MIPFKTLIPIDRRGRSPVYQQIAHALVRLIREGVLRPGAALPSSRDMALLLGVHRKTVTAAYQELEGQDWVVVEGRKGVRVSPQLPVLKPRSFGQAQRSPGYRQQAGFIYRKTEPRLPAPAQGAHRLVITDGSPDPRLAPVDALLKEYRSLYNRRPQHRQAQYPDQGGAAGLRSALASFLADTRGLDISPAHLLITAGAQMAIYVAARMILKPGSTVVVGQPNYAIADWVFEQCGARLLRVPVDDQGLDVDHIARLCRRRAPDLLYIIPHHHHPTTVTLSAERRMKLLELIREYRIPVIEDDYDYDFHYHNSPILPLASADHGGMVLHIGSVTKLLATNFRMGYLVAPEQFITSAIQQAKSIHIRGDYFLEEALGNLFRQGDMQRHIKKAVKIYHGRRDRFCGLLASELGDRVSFRRPLGGLAVWVRFAEGLPLAEVATRASRLGLYMSDGSFYDSGHVRYNGLRMGFAALEDREIDETVGILQSACERKGRRKYNITSGGAEKGSRP